MILSVDPGINGCGCALFRDTGELYSAFYAESRTSPDDPPAFRAAAAAQAVKDRAGAFHVLVVEWPQVYRESKLKGDPNDLLPLAGVDAALCALSHNAVLVQYKPREWKGTVEPDVMIQRILSRLSPAETRAIHNTRASLMHNVSDAIGIGLHYLGRLDRARAIHR